MANQYNVNCLMDAIVNPLEHTEPCRLPDGPNFPTIPLIDYYNESSVTVNVGPWVGSPDPVDSVLIYLQVANTKLFDQVIYHNTPIYSIVVIPILGSGLPVNYFNTIVEIPNILLPNYQNSTYGPLGISKSLRVLAGGIRLLPQVELVTNTSTQYIQKYYTACLSNSDILNWFYNGVPTIMSLFQTSRDFKDYTNMDGVCIRYDSLQYEKQTEFYSLLSSEITASEWFDTDIINSDKWYSTCALVKFRDALTAFTDGTDYFYTFPMRINAKVWLEAQLNEPTSIVPAMGTYNSNTWQYLQVLKRNSNMFPCATSGHTFSSFYSNIVPFYQLASKVVKGISKAFKNNNKNKRRNQKRFNLSKFRINANNLGINRIKSFKPTQQRVKT